jgi:aminopeptidase N
MTQQPQAKYRHDYRAPDYLISDIDLTFDLDATKTVVTAVSKVTRHAARLMCRCVWMAKT